MNNENVQFEVCGIGNALVDVLIEVSDAELQSLGCVKGTWGLFQQDEARAVLERFADRPQALVSGGSVANSLILFAQLGGRAGLFTSLGDDKYGRHFRGEAEQYGLVLGQAPAAPLPTGICVSLVTPDAERTMRAFLGATSLLSAEHLDRAMLRRSRWVFIEGYVFGTELGRSAIRETLRLKQEYGYKVAITFSAVPIVEQHNAELREAVEQADLIFANEVEAQAYSGCSALDAAVQAIGRAVPHAVVTAGEQGAFITGTAVGGGARVHVPALPCVPVDLTGAGDAFAGAYLYGLTQGRSPREAGALAAKLAKQVITQVGARLREPQGVVSEVLA